LGLEVFKIEPEYRHYLLSLIGNTYKNLEAVNKDITNIIKLKEEKEIMEKKMKKDEASKILKERFRSLRVIQEFSFLKKYITGFYSSSNIKTLNRRMNKKLNDFLRLHFFRLDSCFKNSKTIFYQELLLCFSVHFNLSNSDFLDLKRRFNNKFGESAFKMKLTKKIESLQIKIKKDSDFVEKENIKNEKNEKNEKK